MSAPPGFNPENSTLSDPGPSAAPIHVMRGGGNGEGEGGGEGEGFTNEELEVLNEYCLGPGQALENDLNDDEKHAFVNQIKSGNCEAANNTITKSDCWAVSKVISLLIQKGMSGAPCVRKKKGVNASDINLNPDVTKQAEKEYNNLLAKVSKFKRDIEKLTLSQLLDLQNRINLEEKYEENMWKLDMINERIDSLPLPEELKNKLDTFKNQILTMNDYELTEKKKHLFNFIQKIKKGIDDSRFKTDFNLITRLINNLKLEKQKLELIDEILSTSRMSQIAKNPFRGNKNSANIKTINPLLAVAPGSGAVKPPPIPGAGTGLSQVITNPVGPSGVILSQSGSLPRANSANNIPISNNNNTNSIGSNVTQLEAPVANNSDYYLENPPNFQEGVVRLNHSKPIGKHVFANAKFGTRRTRIFGKNMNSIRSRYNSRKAKYAKDLEEMKKIAKYAEEQEEKRLTNFQLAKAEYEKQLGMKKSMQKTSRKQARNVSKFESEFIQPKSTINRLKSLFTRSKPKQTEPEKDYKKLLTRSKPAETTGAPKSMLNRFKGIFKRSRRNKRTNRKTRRNNRK